MLQPWLELDGVGELLDEFSRACGLDLRRLGTTASADELVDTAVTQPLVVATALLAWSQADGRLESDTVVAGHSVGELAAAAIAGVLTPEQAVRLAAIRGREMAEACALEPTGMSAVLGGEELEVLERLTELGLVPANRNATGQIVAAGSVAALRELAVNPPAKARVRALSVAGAFHTHYMESAQQAISNALADIVPGDPVCILLSNADGQPVRSGAEVIAKIAAQVTRPVRWDLCTRTVREYGVSRVVELPPAGTLVGIAKRELEQTSRLAVKTPEDLYEVTGLVAAG